MSAAPDEVTSLSATSPASAGGAMFTTTHWSVVGTYTVAADCTGAISITDGPSFNMYVGPGAQQIWTTQVAGGAGAGAGLGVGRHGCRSQSSDDIERLNE